MAVMYYLGDTAKLGPLARSDLCAWVKGLLDRLMTYLGLGSSEEDPWGSLLGDMGWVAFPGTSATYLGVVLFPWEAWGALCLDECLTACLPELLPACLPELRGYCLLGKDIPLQECCWGDCATCLGRSAVPRKVGNCLTTCLSYCLPAYVEGLLPAWEVPSLAGMLLGGLHCLPGK